MSLSAAALLVQVLEWYLGCGIVFATVLLWRLSAPADTSAGTALGFRILVFPGVALLWPVFVSRLVRGLLTPGDGWHGRLVGARPVEQGRRVEVIR